ncbi:MAG: hypothetical protein ACM3SY_19575 [Candidatus Omnitrophota bacterium]
MNDDQKVSGKQKRYPYTLSEIKIGPVKLPNRIVFPAWQLNYANPDGTVSDKLLKYYTDLAKGGCGLIFTGTSSVTSDGIPFNKIMRVDSDTYVPGLKKLFKAIKDNGAVPGIQLIHYGRQSSTSFSGDTLIAPSAIPCPVMSQYDPQYRVREMDMADIERVRDGYIRAAIRAANAGAEVIEVHAAHGYLLSQFLSPYSNKRTDAYGGSPENRARLIIEILEGIHKELNNRIAVSLRINGDDFVEGGLKADDYQELIPAFEKAGIDLLNISAGVYASMLHICPPKSHGITPNLPFTAKIKQFASVPVCAVGSIISRGLDLAESILAEGKADLCALGRAQMADPEIVNKSTDGRESEIRVCQQCNACTYWTTGDPEAYCTTNPEYTKPKN